MGLYPNPGTPLTDYITEPGEGNAQSFLATNLHNNPYNPFTQGKEYEYIHCESRTNCNKTYHDNVLKNISIALHIQASKTGQPSRSSWLPYQKIRISGRRKYTLLRIRDGMTLTNALSKTVVETSSIAEDGWCSSQPTHSISYMPLSIAFPVIRH